MSGSWARHLIPALRDRVSEPHWLRVERTRRGQWLGLRSEVSGGSSWHQFDLEAQTSTPVSPLEDRDLPGLPIAVSSCLAQGWEVSLLAHKVGRRALIQCRRPLPHRHPETEAKLVKVYRRDRHVMRRWQSLNAAPQEHLRTPGILEWQALPPLLHLELCPGSSLHELWQQGLESGEQGQRVAEILGWLQSHSPPVEVPPHTIDDELRGLQQRLQDYQEIVADPGPQPARVLAMVREALQREANQASAFSHRDFHDKQVLIAGSTTTLIDLDLVTSAPPALDAGNVLAHMRLRGLQGLLQDWQAVAAPVVEWSHQQGLHQSLPRWTAATLLRLALIYCRRRSPADLLAQLFQSAADALHSSAEWQLLLKKGD